MRDYGGDEEVIDPEVHENTWGLAITVGNFPKLLGAVARHEAADSGAARLRLYQLALIGWDWLRPSTGNTGVRQGRGKTKVA